MELAYNKCTKCTSAYSVEATLASFGVIEYDLPKLYNEQFTLTRFSLFCTCCKQSVFKLDGGASMSNLMKILPDAMFYHLFSEVLFEDKIADYLFDKDFDSSNVRSCANVNHVVFLDALVYAQMQNGNSNNSSYQKDLRSMHHSIFYKSKEDETHQLEILMMYKLYNMLTPQEKDLLKASLTRTWKI